MFQIRNEIRDTVARALMLAFRLNQIDQKKVVFKSDRGIHCSDSPLALFETWKKMHPEYRFVWILKDCNNVPEGAEAVKEGSFAEIRALATAKYWVDNKRKGCWALKRKGQVYIQTWHGALFLKRVEKDIEDKLPRYYVKSAKHDSSIADFFLSSCKWSTEYYRRCFWYNGPILEYGVPRSDVFYRDSSKAKEKVFNYYRLDSKDRFLLYAPTFRDDGRDIYALDYNRLLQSLKSKFGGSWKIVVRLHPNIQAERKMIIYSDDVLDGNLIPDINGMIVACDIMITDYSSVMFDAMEAKKTVFLFAPDIDDYRKDRGFTFSLDELPFPIAEDNEQLNRLVKDFNENKYHMKTGMFLDRIGLFNDGHASEKIIQRVLQE